MARFVMMRHTAPMPTAEPIYKRMKRWEVTGDIRFVTFSCERRLPLLANAAIRDVLAAALTTAKARFKFELFAWVVMPEHVHLLLRPRDEMPLDRILNYIKKSVAQRVIARWKELDARILRTIARPDGSPRFWQKGGGFDRNVRDEPELMKEIGYIHRNPVKRGLVERAEQWKWSSARWWLGQREGQVECDLPPGDPRKWKGEWYV